MTSIKLIARKPLAVIPGIEFGAASVHKHSTMLQTTHVRDGAERSVCIIAPMPILLSGWLGTGIKPHIQSLS